MTTALNISTIGGFTTMKKIFAFCLTVLFLSMPSYLILGCAGGGSGSDDDDNNVIPVDPLAPNVYISINQVTTACENGATRLSAYISVVDESGDPVENLTLANFQVSESSTSPSNITFYTHGEEISDPISVTIIMDYSESIFNSEENMIAMEDAVLEFIDLMKPTDRAEIIKFNTEIQLNTGFTSDKSVLEDAVFTVVDSGATYLYDTLYTGIDDVAAESTSRKAVVALSDGGESNNGDKPRLYELDDVISLAQVEGVPLFIVGLVTDDNYQNWVDEMLRLTDETSGQFFQTNTGEELGNIYAKIANLINVGQYVIEFDSTATAATNTFTITVTNGDLSDSANATFAAACP
jgi:VWFA-related protein